MLLRQALEQTRARMPAPVLFNSSIVVRERIDEVSAMEQKEILDAGFHAVHNRTGIRSLLRGSAGQPWQAQPQQAAIAGIGAQA